MRARVFGAAVAGVTAVLFVLTAWAGILTVQEVTVLEQPGKALQSGVVSVAPEEPARVKIFYTRLR